VATFIFYLIVTLSLANLIRMAIYMVTSDIYHVKAARTKKLLKRPHTPSITVIIPAYNEETTIADSIRSIALCKYPKSKLRIIIANDGSTDDTARIAAECIKSLPINTPAVRLINRPNRGKAGAINHILRYYVKTTLVMCLDADSKLDEYALINMAQRFRDRNVIACSSNVNIIEDGTLFTLIQRFEYIVCYQMKRGQALLDVEYIVGGIGSAFRTIMLKKVQFYDTNTMTEDIDLTMKLLMSKRKNQRIAYAHDSIAYTQAAHSLKELSNQRFRWKYGRTQSFLKHKRLFFSKDHNHSKRLSWIILPLSLLQDVAFLFEPLIVGWFIFLIIVFANPSILNSAVILLTAYIMFNLWSSDHIPVRERIKLSYYAPTMYILMYILSLAEYFALIKSLMRTNGLKKSISVEHVTWTSPTRRTVLN
jgi:biofilm PGA synthesis N-glycosyltransferase PgaC